MKITRVSFQRYDLRLAEPYTIAYETIAESVNFILCLETDSGHTGWGCAAPDRIVTGESAEEVSQALQSVIIPFLTGQDPFTYVSLIESLKRQIPLYSSCQAMVDMALLDLVSRKAGVPLYRFLGGYRSSIPTSITLGIMPLDESIRQAREWVAAGFYILKVKGGRSVDEDVEKMLLLREQFPELVLRFDGNQGYSVAEALSFVKRTASVGIELFEQPIRVGEENELGEVTGQVNLPVMADESLKTLSDVFRLARKERVDMVNIKLMKVGGIMEGLHINSVARAAGLEAMVGCNDECSLGISAGLHFALSRPNIEYADLDGHLELPEDPFAGIFSLRQGILYPSEEPGLGPIPKGIL